MTLSDKEQSLVVILKRKDDPLLCFRRIPDSYKIRALGDPFSLLCREGPSSINF